MRYAGLVAIGFVLAACSDGERSPAQDTTAAVAPPATAAATVDACTLVTASEVEKALGHPATLTTTANGHICKIDAGGGSSIEVWVHEVFTEGETGEEMARALNASPLAGSGWVALNLALPAAGNPTAPQVIAKKGMTRLNVTGLGVPYDPVRDVAAAAAGRLR